MKKIYVIAVAFLAFCSVYAANENQSVQKTEPHDTIFRKCPYPDINPKNITTNIAHENDCTKFYKCHLGRKIEQSCPLISKNDPTKRLHYNRALQICDWPWQAGCEFCPGKDQNGNYPPESKIADPKATDCRQYIICRKDGQQDSGTCPLGLCFSRTCQGCVSNLKEDCENINTLTLDLSTYIKIRTITTTDTCTSGDRKRHECDCSKFYQCYENQDWIRQQCDGGLHFSSTTLKCETPDLAKCIS